jgi:hypothetical protein
MIMSAFQWLAIGATAVLLLGVFAFETQRRRRQHNGINSALASLRCPHCGGGFRQWRGEMSGSHYTFIDDVPIPDVIDVACAACGQHADAFWSPSGELTLDGD